MGFDNETVLLKKKKTRRIKNEKKSLIGFRGEGKNLSQRTDENKNVN